MVNPLTLVSGGCALMAAAVAASTNDPFLRLESYPHSLTRPFLDKYLSSRFYDYGGSTLIRSDSFVRLTGDRPGESGWLFSKLPAVPEHFQVEFDFKIHGQSAALYGDGMAFWVTTHKGETGPVFGSSDRFEGLGVFFDTYKNNRPGKSFPYVMAMMGDGKTEYDAAHDGLANEIGGCSGRGLHNPRDVSRARVTFVRNKFLAVDLDIKGQNKWQNCFVITDTSKLNLPRSTFMGFSARTGELSENHDLHRVQVYSLRNPPQSYAELVRGDAGDLARPASNYDDVYGNQYGSSGTSSSSGGGFGAWLWFLFKSIAFLAVAAALGVVGYGLYVTKNKKQKKSGDYYL
ncbi:hypothetical protein DV495_004558 [Geotrichum candidum]|uniref:L-type lectin-like domain-containing protein n=1 Tax=Geotrichum candidum TaxID=1173061 RepID=A0A0J9XIJ1_GEOCN|nr:hypothetical protein DV495_004558 [Geotrichum candidum]KAI9210451.1 hypothetical protein DS838_004663 [Geotrichum bryndzae]KAF5124451.1 hypothetical protein DV452_000160 [Geotrichum candidum]KAF7500553.1 hypothetical protein DV113_001440 [Geotrichum candidum]KAI8134448.1 hypothetical protein DUD61_001911 [Geotrichum candidum]